MSCCVNRKQKDGPDGETETTPGSPKDEKGTQTTTVHELLLII